MDSDANIDEEIRRLVEEICEISSVIDEVAVPVVIVDEDIPPVQTNAAITVDGLYDASIAEECGESPISAPVSDDPDRWVRYEYTYCERGPLMLNVIGQANRDTEGNIISYKIVVDSFETYPGGQPGVSELSGLLAYGDFIVGVNEFKFVDDSVVVYIIYHISCYLCYALMLHILYA